MKAKNKFREGNYRSGLSVARMNRLQSQLADLQQSRMRNVTLLTISVAGVLVFLGTNPSFGNLVSSGLPPRSTELSGAFSADPGGEVENTIRIQAEEVAVTRLALYEPTLPFCVQMIEAELNQLALSVGLDDQERAKALVHGLAQTSIECGDVGLRMSGSLELTSTALADLKVIWDRDNMLLELATVVGTDNDSQPLISQNKTSVEILVP